MRYFKDLEGNLYTDDDLKYDYRAFRESLDPDDADKYMTFGDWIDNYWNSGFDTLEITKKEYLNAKLDKLRRPTPEEYSKAYDLVTIGMRIAYMDEMGLLDIDTTTEGEANIVRFAMKLSEGFHKYRDTDEFGCWDTYIEEAILEKYGKEPEEEYEEPADIEMGFDPYIGCYSFDC